jgi:hypothetical protein
VVYQAMGYDSTRWDGFEFRPGDIVITTPPKCGTTWMQRICGLLIFQSPDFPRTLAEISPWLDMVTQDIGSLRDRLAAQTHRRFIKTHTPLDGLPMDERVTYVCVGRDPRDAAISWDHHRANTDPEKFMAARAKVMGTDDIEALIARDPMPLGDTLEERFWSWVDKSSPPWHVASSLAATLHHFDQALKARDRANVVVLHYAELQADLEGEMRSLAARLGIDVPEPLWPTLVQAATFEDMRANADRLAPNTDQGLFKDSGKFFHSGESGQWRSFLADAPAHRRYANRVGELTTPEVSAWAHRGELG